jgi:hypothetical protein
MCVKEKLFEIALEIPVLTKYAQHISSYIKIVYFNNY